MPDFGGKSKSDRKDKGDGFDCEYNKTEHVYNTPEVQLFISTPMTLKVSFLPPPLEGLPAFPLCLPWRPLPTLTGLLRAPPKPVLLSSASRAGFALSAPSRHLGHERAGSRNRFYLSSPVEP